MESKNKKVIKLDLMGCKYLGEIHEIIREAFGFLDMKIDIVFYNNFKSIRYLYRDSRCS